MSTRPFSKLLVANRGEIAIRVMRAATELQIRTVAIYSHEDRFALHRFKADESYAVGVLPDGTRKGPIAAYLGIDEIVELALRNGVDAIHPGYGFLSENPDFAEACAKAGITFIGPAPEAMRKLGNKVSARELAVSAGVPVMPATGALPDDMAECRRLAEEIGYPLMLKASWGGGGRGMRRIETPDQLDDQIATGRREAAAAFEKDEVYLEKLVVRARHVEVQLLGDSHGNRVHLFERDCSIQRRNQKVVERAPAPYLNEEQRQAICGAALKLAEAADYVNAGTAEFLMDADSGEFYFIEVNPRIQVEHTVTEEVTGIDIVKAQIRIAAGGRIGVLEGEGASGVPDQAAITLHGHAVQCRVTTEDAENNFVPDYGRITAYRGATGFGIRLDGGTAYSGAVITPYYDSLLEKVTAWAPTANEAIDRIVRALREFRIRGVATNLLFLESLLTNKQFRATDYTTRFIDETPALFEFPHRRDRATRLLTFLGEVIVNGNPEVRERPKPRRTLRTAPLPPIAQSEPPPGHRDRFRELGAEKFAAWMLDHKPVLLTDTTMRDAHQSLIATRMRSYDMIRVAPAYARQLSELFSIECWGGATFDVAMRFLKEDPWERLEKLRAAMPNMLLQMLLRANNTVGYTNYPDNAVKRFVRDAATTGIDIFRIFDSLNWVENMRLAMEAVREEGALCEAALCYTGNIFDPDRSKYDLKYYVGLARELQQAGAHILGIKDMAGLCRPEAARLLVKTLKQETGLPVHFHTHDTSGAAAATLIAAAEAGADAVDGAIDSWSGLTSQPNLGSVLRALADTDRAPEVDAKALFRISQYWETVRRYYEAFESDIRSGTSDVYRHEMPGGQYTNLIEQARALGVLDRWDEVAQAYHDVNLLFGDIVKVTPSSKVVGDMALLMVSNGISAEQVADPSHDTQFPDSVIAMFRGDLGQPPGGWPEALQKKILKDEQAFTDRPGKHLEPVDFDALRAELADKHGVKITDEWVTSAVLYPKVFDDYLSHRKTFGEVSVLPTPVFFYGMAPEQEISLELETGKTLVIRLLTVSEPDRDGEVKVFFELNGQPRTVTVRKEGMASAGAHPKAEDGNLNHVAAPMPGLVVNVAVQEGQKVKEGDSLLAIEAMKMETVIHAPKAGTVSRILAPVGTKTEAKDLLIELAD